MSQAGDISAISGPVPPTVATTYVTDDGNAVPVANILNVLGGDGATTSGSSNTITITVNDSGITWEDKSTSFIAVKGHGYFCSATLTVLLPTTIVSPIGTTVVIYVDTTDIVTIQSVTGQFIQIGDEISISGGLATSNTKGSILELVFRPSDTTWHTISSLGVWDLETTP